MRINETIKEMEKNLSHGQSVQELYRCEICKDKGYIFEKLDKYTTSKKCKCLLLEDIKRKKDGSGLGELLEIKTLDNFIIEKPFQKTMKDCARQYVKEFLKGEKHSFAILGQSGAGKTHIMSAVARLLIDSGVSVKYFISADIIRKLQACRFNDEIYNIEFNKIAKAEVLFIDDLFKASITNYYKKENIELQSLNEIFKIVNYRYNKKMPMLLSSELCLERFGKIDQSILGRINEMCDYRFLMSISPDPSKNYRLKK